MADKSEEQQYKEYLDYLRVQSGSTPDPEGYAVPKRPTPLTATGTAKHISDKYFQDLGEDDTDSAIRKGLQGMAGMAAAAPGTGGIERRIPMADSAGGLSRFVGKGGFAPRVVDTLTQGAEGGLISAAQAKEGDRLRAFLTGLAVQGGMTGAGHVSQAIGDPVMQIAVGRGKYTPGVGTELANEGLVGTQGMMRRQAAKGMDRAGASLDEVAANIPGTPMTGNDIAQKVWKQHAEPRVRGLGDKAPSAADLPDLADVAAYADDAASRGALSGTQARTYGKAAGQRAYNGRETAGKGLQQKMSKTEQIVVADALKKADTTGQYAKDSTRFAALAKAGKALNTEPALPKTLIGLLGIGPKIIPGGSAAVSLGGQALTKGGQATRAVAPAVRQGVSTATQEDPERAEYEQYLRETGQSR